jgi:hypothetical protein
MRSGPSTSQNFRSSVCPADLGCQCPVPRYEIAENVVAQWLEVLISFAHFAYQRLTIVGQRCNSLTCWCLRHPWMGWLSACGRVIPSPPFMTFPALPIKLAPLPGGTQCILLYTGFHHRPSVRPVTVDINDIQIYPSHWLGKRGVEVLR